MDAPVIEVRNLTKTYGSTRAVDGLDFRVPAGKVTGFLGPNGAGKTTTIRMVLGLARPDAGEALVFGHPYGRLDRPLLRVGSFTEGWGFHPRRNARDHLAVLSVAAGIDGRRIPEVLDIVQLTKDSHRPVGEFSLGMRQRLGLAGALLGDPEVLILDEPANGLDPAGIRWLRSFLGSFSQAGGTVFVSSHVLAEVAQLAHEVVVIDRGRLITQTSVEGLVGAKSVRVRSPEPDRLIRALVGRGATIERRADGALDVLGAGSEEIGEMAAEERLVLHELTANAQTLEQVFLELTGSEGRIG